MPEKRESVSWYLCERVMFCFKHEAVLHAIIGEDRGLYGSKRTLVPNVDWKLVDQGSHDGCWVTFEKDGRFDGAELHKVRNNIEMMDAACEAMVTGTGAAQQEN